MKNNSYFDSSLKRTAAILLLGILLFNSYGYRLLVAYLESRADQRLEACIGENPYPDAQLVSISVAIPHLSYYTNTDRYESIYGQIRVGTAVFQYVKRRLHNDSLEFLCIPNQAVTRLRLASDEFFKFVNDIPRDSRDKRSGSHPNSSQRFTSDYLVNHQFPMVDPPGFPLDRPTAWYEEALSTCHAPVAEQPPDAQHYTC